MAGIFDITSIIIPETAGTSTPISCEFIATATGGDVSKGMFGVALASGPGSVTLTDVYSGQSLLLTANPDRYATWTPNQEPIPNGTVFDIPFSLKFGTNGTYTFKAITGHLNTSNQIDTVWKLKTATVAVGGSDPGNEVYTITSIVPNGSAKAGSALSVTVNAACSKTATRNPTVSLVLIDSAGASAGVGSGQVTMMGQMAGSATITIQVLPTAAKGIATICPTIN